MASHINQRKSGIDCKFSWPGWYPGNVKIFWDKFQTRSETMRRLIEAGLKRPPKVNTKGSQ